MNANTNNTGLQVIRTRVAALWNAGHSQSEICKLTGITHQNCFHYLNYLNSEGSLTREYVKRERTNTSSSASNTSNTSSSASNTSEVETLPIAISLILEVCEIDTLKLMSEEKLLKIASRLSNHDRACFFKLLNRIDPVEVERVNKAVANLRESAKAFNYHLVTVTDDFGNLV